MRKFKALQDIIMYVIEDKKTDTYTKRIYVKKGEIFSMLEIKAFFYDVDWENEIGLNFYEFPLYFKDVCFEEDEDDYIHVSTEIIERKKNNG